MENPLDNPRHELWQTAESLADKFGVKSSFQDDGRWYLVPQNNSCGPRFAGPFNGVADAFWYLIQNEAHLTPHEG